MADLGFPRGGGAPTLRGGRQPTICLIFPENCMKMKKFWPKRGGARPWRPPPLDPPLLIRPRSNTPSEINCKIFNSCRKMLKVRMFFFVGINEAYFR